MHLCYEDIPEAFLKFLEGRGVSGKKNVEEFLYPRLEKLPSPFLMKGMQATVETIAHALKTHRNIVLWGDYDVDGTTGTALLISFFRHIGKTVTWHIPDRVTEGYGLNIAYLQNISKELNDTRFLLITIDCGISNQKEVRELQQWGVDTIVTDHHALPADLPPCIILNPNQSDCGFKDQNLAGVGVAFYLIAGLRMHLRSNGYFSQKSEPNLKDFLAYTALGTISDMVPLRGINRVLVRAGLEVLEKTIFPGLQALLVVTGITDGKILSDDVGFQLGPKINAAGRMASADLAVNLLVCEDNTVSGKLARKLHLLNIERKEYCNNNLEYALTMIDRREVMMHQCCILKGQFHHGILGILASRLMEIFQVPVVVLTDISQNADTNATIKGSCRSPERYNIMYLLDKCGDVLLAYGGHAFAAGISLQHENFKAFQKRFCDSIKLFSFEKSATGHDAVIDFSIYKAFNSNNKKLFQLLEPFGKGNERPVFRDQSATVIEYRCVGKKKEHLQVSFRSDCGNCKGIGFNLGAKAEILKEGRKCEIVYSVVPNRFNGGIGWQIRILDILKTNS